MSSRRGDALCRPAASARMARAASPASRPLKGSRRRRPDAGYVSSLQKSCGHASLRRRSCRGPRSCADSTSTGGRRIGRPDVAADRRREADGGQRARHRREGRPRLHALPVVGAARARDRRRHQPPDDAEAAARDARHDARARDLPDRAHRRGEGPAARRSEDGVGGEAQERRHAVARQERQALARSASSRDLDVRGRHRRRSHRARLQRSAVRLRALSRRAATHPRGRLPARAGSACAPR